MDRKRYQLVKSILIDALDHDGDDRLRYLDAACGDDAELRREVDSLLAMEGMSSDRLLDIPIVDPAVFKELSLIGGAVALSATPQQVGPYRLVEVLGRGGMGTVFLAEQTEPVARRVALKVVNTSMHDERAFLRFDLERQTLAQLSHPNIAQLYDAGSTDDGSPFFAMELVRGTPINEYCDDHCCDIGTRIELLRNVCAGVAHAHIKGVLHRDLKPSNILVCETDGKPLIKIIDFGIAKAMDRTLGTAGMTVDGLVGTPAYLSPESVSGGADVDIRSDVYSLGVVLYELLTGGCPFSAPISEVGRLLREISECNPEQPSRRVAHLERDTVERVAAGRRLSPALLSSKLSGDLDLIVLKALAKEPAQRYASATALADDLGRYLSHEPIEARPPSWSYRMGKLVRRNRLAAALLSLTLLSIVLAAVFSSLALIRARRAEARSRLDAETSRQTTEFLVGLFEAASPEESRGDEVDARVLLQRGVDRVRGAELPPLQRARVLHTLADVHLRLGLIDQARELATQALEISEKQPVPDASSVEDIELLGNIERHAGRYEVAAPLLERVVAMRQAGGDRAALADACNSLGNLRWRQTRYDEAESLHRQALDLRLALFGADSCEVAASQNNLGALYWSQGRYQEAEPFLRAAAETLIRVHGEDHPRVADALGNLGIVLLQLGQYKEDEELQRRVLRIREKVLGPDHPDTATAANNLAVAIAKLGSSDEVEALYRRALDIRRRVVGEEHPETIRSKSNLGLVLWREKRFREAEPLLGDVLRSRQATLKDSDPRVAKSRLNLALVLRDTGRLDEAEGLMRRALADLRASYGDHHRDVALVLHHLGLLLTSQAGRDREAEAMLRESLALFEHTDRPEPQLVADTLEALAAIRGRDGDTTEAEELRRQASVVRNRARQSQPGGVGK